VAEDADRYRRGIYTFRYRSVPYPQLDTFDTPNGDAACIRRDRSNTPMQALTTLNETTFLEAAQGVGAGDLGTAIDGRPRTPGVRLPSGAHPQARRRRDRGVAAMLDKQRKRLRSGELNAVELVGERSVELAAWTAVSRVLLNLDEAITKE
jgi:hypothetical protein